MTTGFANGDDDNEEINFDVRGRDSVDDINDNDDNDDNEDNDDNGDDKNIKDDDKRNDENDDKTPRETDEDDLNRRFLTTPPASTATSLTTSTTTSTTSTTSNYDNQVVRRNIKTLKNDVKMDHLTPPDNVNNDVHIDNNRRVERIDVIDPWGKVKASTPILIDQKLRQQQQQQQQQHQQRPSSVRRSVFASMKKYLKVKDTLSLESGGGGGGGGGGGDRISQSIEDAAMASLEDWSKIKI